MLSFLGVGGHCEAARGTDFQDFTYCCKDGKVFALKPPGPVRDAPGATLVAAAQNLSREQFIQSYPDAWLEHRPSLERIMVISALAREAGREAMKG
jgi:hypothetical protein